MPLTAEEIHDHMVEHHLGRAMTVRDLFDYIAQMASERGQTLSSIQIAHLTHQVARSFNKFEATDEIMKEFYRTIPVAVQLALVTAILDELDRASTPLRFDELLMRIETKVGSKHEMPPQLVMAARYVLDKMIEEQAVREFIHEDGRNRYAMVRVNESA